MKEECNEFNHEKALRHERRMERMKRREASAPGDTRRAQTWDSRPRSLYDEYDADDDYGPRYYDDNPYGSSRLPAPPVGHGRRA
jgi:hypothetical protein